MNCEPRVTEDGKHAAYRGYDVEIGAIKRDPDTMVAVVNLTPCPPKLPVKFKHSVRRFLQSQYPARATMTTGRAGGCNESGRIQAISRLFLSSLCKIWRQWPVVQHD
jgi:hypothetical protein